MPVRISHCSRQPRTRHCAYLLLIVFFGAALSRSQDVSESVNIHVRADQSDGIIAPSWSFFGYDEPNYTYAPNGKKLLGELSALSPAPVYVRVHNLLTTGDGSASLKWGSTNVYTEDAAGKPVYSWAILDQIFDTFHDAGIKPLVEIGFMPRRPYPPTPNPIATISRTVKSLPDGRTRPRITRSGRNWSFSSSSICVSAMAKPRREHGFGKYGTSPTLDTGKERPKNISSCTIFLWTRFCVPFRRHVLAVPTVPAPRTPKPLNSCASFWTIVLIRKIM